MMTTNNREQSVNPWLAAAIIAGTVLVFALKFHFDGIALAAPYPSHMTVTPAGKLAVRVEDRLFIGSPAGVEEIDLEALSATSGLGNLGFFDNGDLLIRTGEKRLSLTEKLAIFLRQPTEADDPQSPTEGLQRCDLTAMECEQFSEELPTMNRTFWTLVDNRDRVLIAHTGDHKLSLFNNDGKRLAGTDVGFRFPNQLLQVGDDVWVANTNKHELTKIDPEVRSFGYVQEKHNVDTLGAPDTYRWPVSLARVADGWWVLGKKDSLKGGAILRFDEQWNYRDVLELPDGADPGMVVSWRDQVYVSDMERRRVYRFASDGTWAGYLEWPPLEHVLAEGRRTSHYYSQLSLALLGLLALGLTVGVFFGGRQALNSIPAVAGPSPEERIVDPNDPDIYWIETAPRFRRIAYWIIGVLAVMIVLMAVLLQMEEKLFTREALTLYYWLAVILVLIYYPVKFLLTQAIGVKGDLVILKRGGTFVVGRGERIFYRRDALMIDNLMINLGTTQGVFPKGELIQHLYPAMKAARELSALQTQGFVLRAAGAWLKRRWPLVAIVIIALVVGFILLEPSG